MHYNNTRFDLNMSKTFYLPTQKKAKRIQTIENIF